MKILQNWRVWVSKLKEPSHIQDNTQVYEEGKKKNPTHSMKLQNTRDKEKSLKVSRTQRQGVHSNKHSQWHQTFQ